MMAAKFRAGDKVMLLPDRSNPNVRPGIYTITRVMPPSPTGIEYRAKSEMDSHERVLNEAQLRSPAAH